MIKRIVKLTFEANNANHFLEIFQASKNKIVKSKGCHSVELLQSSLSPNIFFTFSIWDSEEDLNNYRHSELFQKTWKNVKVLFAEKPEAWTVNSLEEIKTNLVDQ